MDFVVKLALVGPAQAILQISWVWATLLAMEFAFPKVRRIGLLACLKGLTLSVITVAATGATWVLTAAALGIAGLHPLFAVHPAPTSALGQAVWLAAGTAVSVLAFDFLYYWFHRAQHRFPILWRFHSVHHSIEDVSVANAYAHWTEELTHLPFIAIPTALFVPANLPVLPVAGGILILQSTYVHSQIRFNLGPFWRVIYDNRFHRIHHSIEHRHYDRNFGVLTPLWDWMFGTLYVPHAAEWPATGLTEAPEVSGVWDYLARPFNRRRPVEGAIAAPVE